jgi:hypothetical protein
MAVVRRIEIKNFRSIHSFDWRPTEGFNCIVGSGDAGKSSVLDAIDFCLCARRTLPISDADFYRLDVDKDISITLTLGRLDDDLKNYEKYGDFIRGLSGAGELFDEPGPGLEHVLVLNLTVQGDLEPKWRLISQRAEQKGLDRGLNWGDRQALSPTRLGAWSETHLTWRKGSVLNRLSDESADASAVLSAAARGAREAFGNEADAQLSEALKLVGEAATELGVPIGAKAKAMLDTPSVSIKGGTIALHNEAGVPLRGLGLGSTRLLIAGLQRKVASQSSIVLVDELEHGLEPHRIIRLLGSLGAKEAPPPQQVFATSHSPTVLRELSHTQLTILRTDFLDETSALTPAEEVQGTLRLHPEAFLAPSVLICEGATEVGFVRGLDYHCQTHDKVSLHATGVALVDCDGGDADRPYRLGSAFQSLAYRVGVFRDDDLARNGQRQQTFEQRQGQTFTWDSGQDIEAALMLNGNDGVLLKLVDLAVQLHDAQFVNDHIGSASGGAHTLQSIRISLASQSPIALADRQMLARAAGGRRGWFKTVRHMEAAAYQIVGPDFASFSPDFQARVNRLMAWVQQPHG